MVDKETIDSIGLILDDFHNLLGLISGNDYYTTAYKGKMANALTKIKPLLEDIYYNE